MNEKNLLNMVLISAVALTFICCLIPYSEAHILVIGDSSSDLPDTYTDALSVSKLLKSKGYPVLELYRENATTKNILKGMYGADAIIYVGHGGYQSGNYDNKGGIASPPFALVGSNDFIWGVGDKMREGWDGKLFTAPIKNNIPVILLNSCFATGWVEEYEVSNPISTIYNFARMFTGAGANFYATAWNGAQIVHDFIGGAKNFGEANNQNYEKIVKNNTYNGTTVWHNLHGYASFVGSWLGEFPTVYQTTKYNSTAAEAWYNSDRSENPFKPDLVVSEVIAPISGLKGHKISVINTIKNLANTASNGFYLNFYLKTNSTSPSHYLGQRYITGLGAMTTKHQNNTFIIPTNIAAGKYYIIAFIDAGRNNVETNENNNYKRSTTMIRIHNAYRDLVVNEITANMHGVKDNSFVLSNTIKNTGTLSANSFWVHYYIKVKGETGLGKYVGEKYVTSLDAGTSKHLNTSVTLPTSIAADDYYVSAYVDAHKKVTESIETNNYKSGTIKSV